jgi:hypothetical protein
MKMVRIKKFGVFQTAKVAAIIYFIIVAVLFIPFGFFAYTTGLSRGMWPFGGLMFLFAPIIYSGIAFVVTIIVCLLYNALAQWMGGIEIEIETTQDEH